MLRFVFDISMKIDVSDFNVSCNFFVAHNRIQSLAGTATWIQEFTPIEFGDRIAI